MIVADASAILGLLLRTPAGAAVEARLFRPDETVHAPALIDLEVAQVLRRIWALRENMTAYHAAYVALAEGLRAPLLTCDAKLAAASGTRASIELVQ